jgi:hypothetical protein
MNKLITSLGVLAQAGLTLTSLHAQDKKMNVLFIAVDDLKPWVGAYGDKHAKTPGMDRLAREGVVFKNKRGNKGKPSYRYVSRQIEGVGPYY